MCVLSVLLAAIIIQINTSSSFGGNATSGVRSWILTAMETRSHSKKQEELFAKFMEVIQKQHAEQTQQFTEFNAGQQELMQKQDET